MGRCGSGRTGNKKNGYTVCITASPYFDIVLLSGEHLSYFIKEILIGLIRLWLEIG